MTIRVLFLCSGNSARSQIAEGLLRKIGGAHFDVHSAGTSPKAEIDPRAIAAMADEGIDITSHRPKDLSTHRARHFDYVITLCDKARESCPTLPAAETIHWSFPDPAAAGDARAAAKAFRDTVLGIKRRVELFVTAIAARTD